MTKFAVEISALTKLAVPVSLAQLAVMGMSATDVIIAGQAGTTDLAGMNLGANIWNLISLFFMGISFATQPLVAKQFGANNDDGIKHQLHQSLWMCLCIGLLAMLCVLFAAWGIQFVDYDDGMKAVARGYLYVISCSALPIVLMGALRGTLEGMSLTKVLFYINFSAFLINIPLDYILVNGLFGVPALGGVGCALATTLLVWLMFLACIVVVISHRRLAGKNLLQHFQKPNKKTIFNTVKVGLPIGISILIEMSLFAGSGILIAYFGEIEVGAHAVAITIASMSFMLYMGIGQGITIRASQLLGAGEPEQAWYAIKSGTYFNLILSVLLCIVFVIFTEPLVRLFSKDDALIPLAVVLLYFGAAFQIVDSLQVAAMFGLRAYQDTATPPKYQFFAFWVFGLPLGVYLSFNDTLFGLNGAKGMWFAMVVSLLVVGILLLKRLKTVAYSQRAEILIPEVRST